MIITLQELKQYLQEPLDSSERDGLYTSLIERAESVITNEIGEIDKKTIIDERHKVKKFIIPNVLPIISVSEIKIDDNTLTTDDYSVYRHFIELYKVYGKYVYISYSGGYEEIPEAIKMCALLIVSNWLNLNRNLPPDSTIDYRMSQEAKNLLIPYKMRRIHI
ncbi:MAG: hypothetical protein KA467_00060 [Bacteroidales bacterium]|nr:hypothetical protein [Bacteroidales bacterium]